MDQRRPVKCLIDSNRIAARVKELAGQISADYAGQPVLIVGILKGAWVFLADLVRALTIPVQCDFVMLSSYGSGSQSSGQVKLLLDVSLPVAGKHVLLVEDIIDTGLTIPWLKEQLQARGPASIKVCALLDKPARRRQPVTIDYVGFTIPDHFVVGYGIDYAQDYRELPFVGHLDD